MSTISAGTTTSTALVETGDTTGNLIIQANTSTTVGTFSSTGLAVVGSLTSTTPAAGAFTTLSATGTSTFTTVTGAVSSGIVATYTASGANQSIYSSYIGGSPNVANVYVGADSAAGGISGIGSGGLLWNVGNAGLAFGANNALAMSLSTTGALALKGASTSATGVGITFPATQSASTDANTLDDYEEGTWTPSVGGTATYAVQTGQYTKIGNFVKIKFHLNISVLGTGNAARISGIPFNPAGSDPVIIGGVVTYINNLATAALAIGLYAQGAYIYFMTRDTSTTGSTLQQPAVIGNSFDVYAEISYLY